MTEPSNNSTHITGSVIQEPSNPPDVLKVVQRRAKKASDYYHLVLTNGNLRRGSDDAVNRHSNPSDQNFLLGESNLPASATTRSQPTTPVRIAANRSQIRLKPSNNPNSTDEEDFEGDLLKHDKARTFPRKVRAQDRIYTVSKSGTVRVPSSQSTQRKLSDAINYFSQSGSSPERFSSLQRNSDIVRATEDEHLHSDNKGTPSHSPVKPSVDKDYTIVYTLPNVRHRRQPARDRTHYYETVELPSQKDRPPYFEPVELPPKKERVRNYETIEVGTHDGTHDRAKMSRHTVSTTNLTSHSSGSSPILQHKRDKENEYHLQEFRKNKHHTVSGSSPSEDQNSHLEVRHFDSSSSPKRSPIVYRRNKSTLRSRSDVIDHHIFLNQLQDMQSEKDAQKLFASYLDIQCPEQTRLRRHHFAHYDWQSMLFSFEDAIFAMETLKRKNTPSGASKAVVVSENLDNSSNVHGSEEDISNAEINDDGYERSNSLVASCPYFQNEVGGESDRSISVTASSDLSIQVRSDSDAATTHAQNVLTNHTFLSVVEHSGSSPLLPPNSPPSGSVRFGVENNDVGALYYRSHFYEKEHQNLVGIDDRFGPVVISVKREKVEDGSGSFHQYRLIVRTSELCTLRGSILEDVICGPRNPPNKGYSPKEVIEYVCPEIDISCLKVASAPKVQEQIMKVDEHNVQNTYKVGVMYCKAGQVTEEDMYNNEHGSEAFEQFLNLIGKKVKLNGFDDFKGGLDVTTDSTGTESIFTTFNGYKIMFHVSTLLPFSPTNRQQLLRKRHIGNDITTIVFQEPGSEPFNPLHVRSHFQHVFVIVRVHNPCSENTCYSVSVTRSRNISRFGPPTSEDSMHPISAGFREFLLTKVINGENTAHYAGKFKALAMNTREQYLRDLALNYTTLQHVESTPLLVRISINAGSRRNKDKQKRKSMPQELSRGGLTWNVTVTDYRQSEPVPCILGISDCVLTIVEPEARKLIFSMPCQAVLGWSVPPPSQKQMRTVERNLHIFYGRGERLSIKTEEIDARDEIILRLERFTKGSETVYREFRRSSQGELGFNINYEGIIMDLDPNGHAAVDGLKQSSRLLEICKVSVATMTHDEILDLLRTSERVTVVIVPPFEDGTPRKCSKELYHLCPKLEVKHVDLKTVVLPSSGISTRSRSIGSRPVSNKRELHHSSIDHREHSTASMPAFENYVQQHFKTRKGSKKMKRKKSTREKSSQKKVNSSLANAAQLAMDNISMQSLSSHAISSTKSSFSNCSGPDVDWKEGSTDLTYHSSSESGFNSNNNSSHTDSLNRSEIKLTALRENMESDDVDKRKPLVLADYNRNNNNSSPGEQIHNHFQKKCLQDDNTNKRDDFTSNSSGYKKKSSIYLRSKSVIVTKNEFNSSQSSSTFKVSEDKNPKTVLANKQSETTTVSHCGPKLRASIRNRFGSCKINNSSCKKFDVQSSLIKLITSDSPVKQMDSQRAVSVSSIAHRSSPKRKFSPFAFSRQRSTHHSLTNQSSLDFNTPLPSSIGDERSDRLQEHGSYQRLNSFPLPSTPAWEELLNAAEAAEAFDLSSLNSSSNCNNIAFDSSHLPKRDINRDPLTDANGLRHCNDRHSSSWLKPSHQLDENQSTFRCDLKLKLIEKEMKTLQKKLLQEKMSRTLLEKEVLTLRRNNTFLLRQVRVSNPRFSTNTFFKETNQQSSI